MGVSVLTLFVGNLPWSTTSGQLREVFVRGRPPRAFSFFDRGTRGLVTVFSFASPGVDFDGLKRFSVFFI